jgi:hypothetical protein
MPRITLARLDAIAHSKGRSKGVAVVPNDCSDTQLDALRSQGVIGIAFNPSLMGFDFYSDLEPLLLRLKNRNMWAQFQVEKDLLLPFLPMINRVGARF